MNKNIFIPIVLLLTLSGCSKDELNNDEVIPTVTISFHNHLVASNSMCRSDNNEFLNIIQEQTPNYINVTLKNIDLDKTYKCKSNESITIPIGNYEINGEYNASGSYYSSSDSDVIYKGPCLKCDTFTTTINDNSNKITLNTYYNCFAVFALIDECKSCGIAQFTNVSYDLFKYNKYYYGYFKKDCNITLTPYDDSTEFITTTYKFSTIYNVNKVFAEYGKYYILHPQKVNKTNANFNLIIPDMIQGEI